MQDLISQYLFKLSRRSAFDLSATSVMLRIKILVLNILGAKIREL